MLYHLYELNQAALRPARAAAEAYRLLFRNPLQSRLSHAPWPERRGGARAVRAHHQALSEAGLGHHQTEVKGRKVAVRERTLIAKPFCNLVHFEREVSRWRRLRDPKILVVAPMAGHFSTLLRGTVRDLLPHHEVYVTEWQDARFVPRAAGPFDLDVYIDYIIEFLRFFRGNVHVMAVCQPTVPVFAAVSLMEADGRPLEPALHDPHGRPDRCAGKPDGGQSLRRGPQPSSGSSATSSPRCRGPIPA